MSKALCQVTTIHFKTNRGRHVVFRGRRGGQTSNGGICAVKGSKPGEKRAQSHFARAARKCHQKNRRQRNACVKHHLR